MNSSADNGEGIAAASSSTVLSTRATMPDIGNMAAFSFDDLPVELIIRVLHFAVDICGGTNKDTLFPYTALLVSKRWHDIALSAPELWTAVSVDLTSTSKFPDQLNHLKRHSTRSRKRSLDVTWTDSDFAWPSVLESQSKDDVRWKSLRVQGDFGPLILLTLKRAAQQLDEGARCLTSLETLVIVDRTNPRRSDPPSGVGHLFRKILRGLTTLKTVHTRNISLKCVAPSPGGRLSVTSLLEELVIEDADPEAVPLFSWVDFPALRTLGIQCRQQEGRADEARIHTGVKFPALKNVILYEVDSVSAIAILGSSPEVQSLAISHTGSPQTLRSLTDPGVCPKLATLIVHGTVELSDWEAVKGHLPTMERLVLDAVVAEEAGVGWLRGHVEVETLGAGELEFGKVCRRLSLS